jgi:signal transduction histidine kinase
MSLTEEVCMSRGEPTQVRKDAPIELPSPEARTAPSDISVLMIEDDMTYYRWVWALLNDCAELTFTLHHASSLADATLMLTDHAPDVILLDMNLPDSSGLDTLLNIKEEAAGIPIIILTASDDREVGLKSVSVGAQDFLVKQRLTGDALTWCIRYAIERYKTEQSRLRTAAIQDFTAALAHDLRTPMIGADYLLDVLLMGALGQVSAQQIPALEQLKQSNSKQLKLVQKLLEIYRYEAAGTETHIRRPIDLERLLGDCILEWNAFAAHAAPIELEVESSIPPIDGDESALLMLFGSLIENAIKFGDKDGKIKIQVTAFHGEINVHVHNFGDPISEDMQKRLFQNFWQGLPGKRSVPNTGLGLYLSQRIAALHGGKIRCSSTEKHGTTFSVVLPS